jgi:hypothetical protein
MLDKHRPAGIAHGRYPEKFKPEKSAGLGRPDWDGDGR